MTRGTGRVEGPPAQASRRATAGADLTDGLESGLSTCIAVPTACAISLRANRRPPAAAPPGSPPS